MTELPNLSDIALRLMELSKDLERATSEAADLDEQAVRTRHEFEIAYSREFLRAEGSMELRKHKAVEETADLKFRAEAADQVLRACRTRISTIKIQIETGRSLSAAVRAEVSLAGAAVMT